VPIDPGPDGAKAREALARLRARATQHKGPPISIDEILEWKRPGQR
jgi:hypothetical protein